MRYFFALIALVFYNNSTIAQDPHLSQSFNSPLSLNPAFTGRFNGAWRITAQHKDQWPSIPNAYVSSYASFDLNKPIFSEKLDNDATLPRIRKGITGIFGFGISGYSDKSANGALARNTATLSGAYNHFLDGNGYESIGVGFQLSYTNMIVDLSKLTFGSQLTPSGFDPSLPNGTDYSNEISQAYMRLNAGALFNGTFDDGTSRYFLGLSGNNIYLPQTGTKTNVFTDSNNLRFRWNLVAGGIFPISYSTAITTSILYQNQNKANEVVFGGALVHNLNNSEESPINIFAGCWRRFRDSRYIPYIGLEAYNAKIAASYDINSSGLSGATNGFGGLEFSIVYIHNSKPNCPPVTPRPEIAPKEETVRSSAKKFYRAKFGERIKNTNFFRNWY